MSPCRHFLVLAKNRPVFRARVVFRANWGQSDPETVEVCTDLAEFLQAPESLFSVNRNKLRALLACEAPQLRVDEAEAGTVRS